MTKAVTVRGDNYFSNVLVAESRIVGQGMLEIPPNLQKITLPALKREGVISLEEVLF